MLAITYGVVIIFMHIRVVRDWQGNEANTVLVMSGGVGCGDRYITSTKSRLSVISQRNFKFFMIANSRLFRYWISDTGFPSQKK